MLTRQTVYNCTVKVISEFAHNIFTKHSYDEVFIN